MSTDVWTSTEQGNLALIQAVKKHPCLYNNTLPEYSQKDVTSAAWQEIAEQFGCSEAKVRSKWRGIRCIYLREKIKLCNGKKKRAYYLDKHLNFLLPFTQSRKLLKKLANMCHDETENTGDTPPDEQSVEEFDGETQLDEQSMEEFDEEIPLDEQSMEEFDEEALPDEQSIAEFNEETLPDEQSMEEFHEETSRNEQFIEESDEETNSAPETEAELAILASREANRTHSVAPKVNSEQFQTSFRIPEQPVMRNYHNTPNQPLPSHEREPQYTDPLTNCIAQYDDSRKQFMMSFIPEVEELPESKFRMFKRKVLELIDDIKFDT